MMLLYFYSINRFPLCFQTHVPHRGSIPNLSWFFVRREIREAGLTLVFDARKAVPQPQLYKALMTLQVKCTEINELSVGWFFLMLIG